MDPRYVKIDINSNILEDINNIEQAVQHPLNSLDVSRLAQSNHQSNSLSAARLNLQLNTAVREAQMVQFEEKITRFNDRFKDASDAVRSSMLHEFERGLSVAEKEEYNIARVRDPPEMSGKRRTFGKGGKRRLTAAEIAAKELERDDKQSVPSERSVVGLTSPFIIPTRPQSPSAHSSTDSGPFVMAFSQSSQVIRSSNRPLKATTQVNASQVEDPDFTILDSYPIQSTASFSSKAGRDAQLRLSETKILAPASQAEFSSQISPSRPQRQTRQRSVYEGELGQLRKRVKRCN